MPRFAIELPDELKKGVSDPYLAELYGSKRGAVTDAINEAVKLWLKETKRTLKRNRKKGLRPLNVLACFQQPSLRHLRHLHPSTVVPAGPFTDTSATTVLITGTGYYDHLGFTTLRFPSTITGNAACGGFTATEQDTYTGANGDSVFQTVHDTICPTSTPGTFQLNGSFTVTGGTGRFIHASGSGAVSASVNFTSATSGTFAGTQTGTITY